MDPNKQTDEAVPATDELMLTQEVAARCRAPLSTVRYWRHRGEGPRSFKIGRRVVYRRSDVEEWLAEQARAGA